VQAATECKVKIFLGKMQSSIPDSIASNWAEKPQTIQSQNEQESVLSGKSSQLQDSSKQAAQQGTPDPVVLFWAPEIHVGDWHSGCAAKDSAAFSEHTPMVGSSPNKLICASWKNIFPGSQAFEVFQPALSVSEDADDGQCSMQIQLNWDTIRPCLPRTSNLKIR
jgi:hypothetical protein